MEENKTNDEIIEDKREIEIKQEFLTEQIIKAGYDPELFMWFCGLKKEVNLDLWTMDELKKCVAEFQARYKVGQTLEQIRESGTMIIKGSKLAPSELSSTPSIEIIISEPKLIDSGFFTPNYIVYIVQTLPLNWEVSRKFSDFIWLRRVILLSFPGIFIPPLSKLKSRGNFSEDTLIKRYKCLNKFVRTLISHPLIVQSEQLRIFLKQVNHKAFEEYIENDTTQPIEEISHFPSINGELKGDLVDHSENILKMEEFYKRNAEIMKKLKEKANKIVRDLKNITTAILNMTEIVLKLEKIQDAMLFTTKYQEIYAKLRNHLEKLTENQKKKIELANDHLAIFYKYEHLEHESLNSFVQNNEKHSISFRLALLKHSETLEKSRELYAYFNSQNIRETKRLNKQITQDNYQNFFRFCLEQASLAKDLQNIWTILLDEMKL